MRIALLQTALPDYRRPAVDLLAKRLGGGFTVYAGEDYFDPSIRTAMPLQPCVRPVRNRFVARRRLLWQSGCARKLLRADVVVAELNPRVLSTWAVLILRRVGRRATVLWGHAWPRAGRTARSDFVRHLMRRLATLIIVYSETQAAELSWRMPRGRVVAAPNALYPAAAAQPLPMAHADAFVCTGRLVDVKKPLLLLEAFLRVRDALPPETTLVFVGDGPLRSALEETAHRRGQGEHVIFTGHLSDPAALAPLYARAFASVSPGYAGLSLVQSLAFGVPAVIARDEPHAPEIEAAIEGFNCRFVDSDAPDALGAALVDCARETDMWRSRRQAIADDCASRYSLETMVERLAGAITEAAACAS